MTTDVLPVDAANPDPAVIARAAAVLREGGLVAFPTETVYGLGADALNAEAVRKIFKAKGRPQHNPLIVHAPDAAFARTLTSIWPEDAARLAECFWPGPLTLVLPRAAHIPTEVTAGGATVAVRVPAHPVALALLKGCRLPLAAPSANLSGQLSPTQAGHVLAGLRGKIDLLLDAGPTSGGLESTVVDLTTRPVRLLRPGLVTMAELEGVLGPIEIAATEDMSEPLKSPGRLERHYAPHTPLECVEEDGGARASRLAEKGLRVGWLSYRAVSPDAGRNVISHQLPGDATGYAAGLFAALHKLDAAHLDRILVAQPPSSDDWLAVRDRLRRAASG